RGTPRCALFPGSLRSLPLRCDQRCRRTIELVARRQNIRAEPQPGATGIAGDPPLGEPLGAAHRSAVPLVIEPDDDKSAASFGAARRLDALLTQSPDQPSLLRERIRTQAIIAECQREDLSRARLIQRQN